MRLPQVFFHCLCPWSLNFSISPSIYAYVYSEFIRFDEFLASNPQLCRHLTSTFFSYFLQAQDSTPSFSDCHLIFRSPRFLYQVPSLILNFIFSCASIFSKPLQCLFHIYSFSWTGSVVRGNLFHALCILNILPQFVGRPVKYSSSAKLHIINDFHAQEYIPPLSFKLIFLFRLTVGFWILYIPQFSHRCILSNHRYFHRSHFQMRISCWYPTSPCGIC